jgi:phospholipid N-methyltransferase
VLARLELTHADCVVSGIPFKTLREDLREVIVNETHRVLRPDGQFLVYQLSDVVLPYLERAFGSVSQNLERRSLLPARMFYCAR